MTLPIVIASERTGDSFAFRDEQRTVSYRQLVADVERQAHYIARFNISKGDHVLLARGNTYETLVNLWAVWWLGAVACVVSGRFSLKQSMAIREQLQWKPFMPRELWRGEGSCVCVHDGESPATIVLSSGSTGTPKAIVHSLDAHIASAEGAATNMPLRPGDRWLWSLPVYHVSGLSIVVRCAVAGATLVALDGQLTARKLAENGITHLSLVSTQLRRLLEQDGFPDPALQGVLVGGSSVPRSLIDAARARGVSAHTTYGMTETASQVTTSTASCDPRTSGRVLPNRELKIQSGEIFVRGGTLCMGYWRERAIEPVTDNDGWFHTGDLGELSEDGLLTVVGRIDNMFVSGGENIYPEAIERALLQLEGITQAIVVPREDEEFGARPVAFVEGDLSLSATWKQGLSEKLRRFEIPDTFLAWPKEVGSGIKPSRRVLRELAADAGKTTAD